MTRKGFTLIELLLVIGIIAILAAIVIVAINPTKQLGDARNAQRQSDVNTILNAVYQYSIDNRGTLPGNIPTGTAANRLDICVTTSLCGSNALYVNLSSLTGSYLVKIPSDPQIPSGSGAANYTIVQDSNKRITVSAPKAEQGKTISITR